jgi:hypothetical protein
MWVRERERERIRSRARKQSRVGVLSPRSQILAPFPKTPVGPPKGAAGKEEVVMHWILRIS